MSPDTVHVIRDTDGIPHIRAGTVDGAFRGQGFAAAQDRLWQLEFDRRRATGQLAAAIGAAGLPADTFHRRLDLAGAAHRTLEVLAEDTRRALSSYADGVNAYLDTDPELPPEFGLLGLRPEPWEPWHTIAVYQFRHLAMGTYETKLWRSGLVANLGASAAARLWPSVAEVTVDPGSEAVRTAVSVASEMAAAALSLAAFGEESASNNLAVAPGRTATGRPLLAGDPHRAIDLPNVYWQNHVTCADPDAGFDVIGLSFPGVPGFPHFGHNERVAWCVTHGMADDQDLYVVRLHRDGSAISYDHDGGRRTASVRTEQITVAGGEPALVECVSTHHGPVIAGSDTVGLALAWTALAAPDTTADALVPMLRVRSVGELDTALRPWVLPVNNLLMADVDGSIAYRMRGRLAVRATDNGWTAVPGDDPARDWTGFVEDAALPRWRDPEQGFLVTANNRVAATGPYVSHDWAHPTRARRLSDLVGARSDWDTVSVRSLLGDTHSRVAEAFAARITAVAATHPLDARAQRLVAEWDHRLDAGSAAAAVYGMTRAELVGLTSLHLGLVHDRLPGVAGPTMHTTMRLVNARLAFWIDDSALVPDELVATALRFAVRRLELTQGTDPQRWRWGAAHTALFVHPLAALRPDLAASLATPPPVELGGDNECVWATSTAPPSVMASNGQVARYVFDVGAWDDSVWIVPHGVAADPRSPHHLDQLEDWATQGFRPMRYSPAAVDAATESITVLP